MNLVAFSSFDVYETITILSCTLSPDFLPLTAAPSGLGRSLRLVTLSRILTLKRTFGQGRCAKEGREQDISPLEIAIKLPSLLGEKGRG